MPQWLSNFLPILLLLGAVLIVVRRLPRIEMGHSDAFRRRRVFNWLPLGLTYAFLYFGRYNINEATSALGKIVDNAGFGTIFAVGSWVYGVSFLVNGPLTDRLGGRKTILIAALGSALSNLLMGGAVYAAVSKGVALPGGVVGTLSVLFGLNMYFQSFGAVSIVKVNAAWFHVRERGVQGGVFGVLIALGIYFGYDWSRAIARAAPEAPWLILVIPAIILVVMFGVSMALVRDTPSETGHPDFDLGDATAADDDKLSVAQVFLRMFRNRVILIIIAIEFCTGYLRNGVMSWYPKFARAVDLQDDFVSKNWGLLLCVFGIVGGMFAGVISDRVFHSRRGPVASVLYGGITLGSIVMLFTIEHWWVGWVLVFMALNYVGVHGMLSGTASADFGGRKNTGVAVGVIDGFVYLGTGVQSLAVGLALPTGEAAKDAANWIRWPMAMVPLAIIGLILCTRVWHAKPRAGGGH
ncbi:MAG: MFS transporter [Deltaproteobacteria bacterium]|nr:MFS transporter [Deltaproteobacteria bacterium]